MTPIYSAKRPGTSKAKELLKQVAKQYRIDVKSLTDKAHRRYFVQARRAYCVLGMKAGIGVYALADVLCRDRTTVLYHQRPQMRERKKEKRPVWVPRKLRRRAAETTGEMTL